MPPLATNTMSSADRRRLSVRGGGGGGSGAGSSELECERECECERDGVRAGGARRRRRRRGAFPGSHSLSSFAILDAMFLKPMLVPGKTINF